MLGTFQGVLATGRMGLRRWGAGRRRRGDSGRRAHQPFLEGLEERLTLSTATWTGLGLDTNWTTAANWVNNTPPNPGDDLIFPLLTGTAGSYTSVNNFSPGTEFDSLTIGAPGYTLSGNGIELTSPASNILATYNSGTSTDSINTMLDSGTISVGAGGTLDLSGQISGSAGLSLFGGGTLDLLGANTYTGTTTIASSTLLVDSTTGPVQVSGGVLGGNGTVGSVNTVGGTLSPGHGSLPGVLTTTGGVTLDSASRFNAVLNGNMNGNGVTGFDQLVANGPVNLGGATLNASIGSSYTPATGDQLPIILNQSGSPVTGTFKNLPEGATFTVSGTQFQISYQGGTNHQDVVLTVVSTPATNTTSTTLTTSSQIAVVGQPVTFTATVTPATPSLGTPTGTVFFFDGTTFIGQAPLNSSAQAMFTTSSLAYGGHSITAVYSGNSVFQSSTSNAVTQFITSAATSPTLTIVPLRIHHGKPGKLELVAQINVAPPATGTPLGNTVFFINGRAMYRTVPVINGRAVLTLPTARVNNKIVYARYLGYFAEFQPALSNSLLINRWALRAVTAVTKAQPHPHHSARK